MIFMNQELTTEEAEHAIENRERIPVRIHVFTGEDVAAAKIIGFVGALEEKESDVDIIVFSHNSLVQTRITKDGTGKKSKVLERFLFGLHLDYLPYTDVIISVPKNDANQAELERLCLKFGVD